MCLAYCRPDRFQAPPLERCLHKLPEHLGLRRKQRAGFEPLTEDSGVALHSYRMGDATRFLWAVRHTAEKYRPEHSSACRVGMLERQHRVDPVFRLSSSTPNGFDKCSDGAPSCFRLWISVVPPASSGLVHGDRVLIRLWTWSEAENVDDNNTVSMRLCQEDVLEKRP